MVGTSLMANALSLESLSFSWDLLACDPLIPFCRFNIPHRKQLKVERGNSTPANQSECTVQQEAVYIEITGILLF